MVCRHGETQGHERFMERLLHVCVRPARLGCDGYFQDDFVTSLRASSMYHHARRWLRVSLSRSLTAQDQPVGCPRSTFSTLQRHTGRNDIERFGPLCTSC